MSALKILHICTSPNGGAGRAAFRLHESLLKNGVESYFMSLYDESSLTKNEKLNFIALNNGPSNILFRIVNKIQRIFRVSSAKRHIKLVSEYNGLHSKINAEITSLPFSNFRIDEYPIVKKVDIVNLHWVSKVLDYPTFFKNINKPVVWTLHDLNPVKGIFHYEDDEKINETLTGDLNKQFVKIKIDSLKSFRNTLQIVTPSHWLQDKASKSPILGKFQSEVIPYCIDFNHFPVHPKMEYRKELNIPDDGKILLLFVSQMKISNRKGLDLVLEAAKFLPEHTISIVLVGTSAQFSIPGVTVTSTGLITNDAILAKYYSSADAVILPSREDNLPNVILESFSCGTPIIGFPIGGIKEHVLNKHTGILAENISSLSLANAIKEFIETKNSYESSKIREYAEIHFSERIQVEAYMKLYNRLKSSRNLQVTDKT